MAGVQPLGAALPGATAERCRSGLRRGTVIRLLQINSSIFNYEGESTRLATRFVTSWKTINPTGVVTVRDLGHCPIPHLDANRFLSFVLPPEQRTSEQRDTIELSDMLIAELKATDILVIGAPMYNLNIPSGLKSYIDHITRAGETFRYTDAGPVGLLPEGKRAVIFSTRGGVYSKGADMVVGYLTTFLSLIGIADVSAICAEGLQIGAEARTRGLKAAETQLASLLDNFSPSSGQLPCSQTRVQETPL